MVNERLRRVILTAISNRCGVFERGFQWEDTPTCPLLYHQGSSFGAKVTTASPTVRKMFSSPIKICKNKLFLGEHQNKKNNLFLFIRQPPQDSTKKVETSSLKHKKDENRELISSSLKISKLLPLSNVIGVGEVNCRINPDDQDARNPCCFRVLFYVPIQASPWYFPEHCSSRSCNLKENLSERYSNLWTNKKYCSREHLKLITIKRPISTDTKTTPKKAPMQATKSDLSIFHMRIIASKSISPRTADIMMDAKMAFGVYLNNGVMISKVSSTTIDMTMLETAELHPAMKFTADLEKDPAKKNN
ncbi:hypothetical protein Leryth_022909 [Lithospermum erythrorhizon]|nr:hypothetical protein Leryth_022909 [Lithospermum erythrorhizon]